MKPLLTMLLITWLAGLAAWVGGLVGHCSRATNSERSREWMHAVMSFGGGILLSAVAFALVPEGLLRLSPATLAITVLAGGIMFCVIDAWLANRGGSYSQLMAMLMDFVPESIALGATFLADRRLAILLALFIGVQNIPEGFNSYREMNASGWTAKRILIALATMSLLGPMAAAAGHLLLRDHREATALIMSFAGGGILYLIFQDIAPQAKMQRHWLPSMGAVVGFVVGMVGEKLLG